MVLDYSSWKMRIRSHFVRPILNWIEWKLCTVSRFLSILQVTLLKEWLLRKLTLSIMLLPLLPLTAIGVHLPIQVTNWIPGGGLTLKRLRLLRRSESWIDMTAVLIDCQTSKSKSEMTLLILFPIHCTFFIYFFLFFHCYLSLLITIACRTFFYTLKIRI